MDSQPQQTPRSAWKTRRPRPHLVLLLLLLLLGVLALPLAGCGSSEDITTKPAAQILAASRTAAQHASSVHVLSQTHLSRTPLTLELHLAGQEGGSARLTIGQTTSEAVRMGNTLYLKAGPTLTKRLEEQTGQRTPHGSWTKLPASAPQSTQFTALTQPSGELTLLLNAPTLSLTKGPITTINGHKAIELKTKGKLYTGQIYIAATGTPYPIKIVKHGQENSTTTFTSWNQPITITPPANIVNLNQTPHKSS